MGRTDSYQKTTKKVHGSNNTEAKNSHKVQTVHRAIKFWTN